MIILNAPLAPLQAAREAASGIRWLLFVFLAATLLFAHGCHRSDVDHELCAPEISRAVAK
jgi:hypothetical protein